MSAADREVLVGCCGYSYDEWVGPFYPPESVGAAGRLDHYALRFPALELDFTYYGMPTAKGLVRYARPDLAVVVKAHRTLTHEREHDLGPAPRFREALAPLVEAGNLLAVLGQFPQSFHHTRANAVYVRRFHDALAGIPWIAEFRSATWADERVFGWLERHGIALCLTDQPALPGLFPRMVRATSDLACVRFHGRNARAWHAHDDPKDRYTWDYTDQELRGWIASMAELLASARRVAAFFNNHALGAAPRDAARFSAMLMAAGLPVRRAGPVP